jgi:hypothetical protein
MKWTAIIKKSGDWWIGWIEEMPGVNCQERSKDELLASLKQTLIEALEMNRFEALKEAHSDYIEEALSL